MFGRKVTDSQPSCLYILDDLDRKRDEDEVESRSDTVARDFAATVASCFGNAYLC